MAGTTRDQIHATVGSITISWNPHHRSVEYPSWFRLLSTTSGECKRRPICLWKDLNEIFLHHSRCVCPPPPSVRKKASQNLIIQEGLCTGMRDLHATLRKHNWSVVFIVSFRQLRFEVWGLVFSRPEIEPFSALLFLVFGCFVKNACNVGGNNREHLSDIDRTAPQCRHLFCNTFQMGRWHCEL